MAGQGREWIKDISGWVSYYSFLLLGLGKPECVWWKEGLNPLFPLSFLPIFFLFEACPAISPHFRSFLSSLQQSSPNSPS